MVLDRINAAAPPADHPQVFQILSLRREITERYYQAQIADGKRLRHLAEAKECEDRLRYDDEVLSEAAAMDIQGRLMVAEASAEHCEHNAQLYRLEVQAYLVQLTSIGTEDHGLHELA